MLEAMAQYQKLYGFAPRGRHIAKVRELLGPYRVVCPECDSSGLVSTDTAVGWAICSACNGLGATLVGTGQDLDAIRRELAAEFPEAVGPHELPEITSAFIALDNARGVLVDLRVLSAENAGAEVGESSVVQSGLDAYEGGIDSDEDSESEEEGEPDPGEPPGLSRDDEALLVADELRVAELVAKVKDPEIAGLLQSMRTRSTTDAAEQLCEKLDWQWYGATFPGLWNEELLEDAQENERWYWVQVREISVQNRDPLYFVTTHDAYSVVDTIGIFANIRAAELTLLQQGALETTDWPA